MSRYDRAPADPDHGLGGHGGWTVQAPQTRIGPSLKRTCVCYVAWVRSWPSCARLCLKRQALVYSQSRSTRQERRPGWVLLFRMLPIASNPLLDSDPCVEMKQIEHLTATKESHVAFLYREWRVPILAPSIRRPYDFLEHYRVTRLS